MPDGYSKPEPEGPQPDRRKRTSSRAAIMWAKSKKGLSQVHWALIARMCGAVMLFLFLLFAATAFFDWNALRGPVSRIVGGALHRTVRIEGPLDVDIFTFTPRVQARNIVIGNPEWATRDAHLQGDNITLERFSVETRLLPFIFGDHTLNRVELQNPVFNFFRAKDGRATWNFSSPANSEKPLSLPAIQEFLLRDGKLTLHDEQRQLTLAAALTSTENVDTDTRRPFALRGDGIMNGQPFKLIATGGSLLNVRRDRPYPFQADIAAGSTRAILKGQMHRPFDFGQMGAKMDVSGPDMALLYPLTGVTLPNTPPYNLSATMERVRTRFELHGIKGRVGDTDLAGELAVDRQPDNRPILTADLKSKKLDFDDLATVLGAPPSTARGETVSQLQYARAQTMAAQGRLLPDAKLNVERVRNMDARVFYAAESVSSTMLPLRRASATITLDKGLLTLSPLSFSLPRGDITSSVRINARESSVPMVDLDAKLKNGRLEDFFAKKGIENAVTGLLQGRIRLSGRGGSVRDAAAHASGQVTFVAPKGEIRAAFAELLGVNVTRGLGLLLAKDQSQLAVRCGVANFRATNGMLRAETIVFDTETVIADGEGFVNLGDETINLRLKGHPKEMRLVRVAAPITVTGHLRAPQLGVEKGGAVGQLGIAAALSAVLTPLASILPFVDAGLADDADCGALIAQAKEKGAAGRLATTPPKKP